MTEPPIVTPQEAQRSLTAYAEDGQWAVLPTLYSQRLARTVATEPERIRAAVVKELDALIEVMRYEPDSLILNERRNAIENGANYS